MLYTIIRDFYVQHVFGGLDSNGEFHTVMMSAYQTQTNGTTTWNNQVQFQVTSLGSQMNISDWLSTTSTIITLIVILVCIGYFIRWIIKVFSNSILLR